MNLQNIDGLDWIRGREAQLFAAGRANPMGIMAYLVADVLELGKGACHVLRRGEWWVVSSDVDWMSHPDIPVRSLFERVVPAPAHGAHSLRAEVILSAFAQDLLTGDAKGERLVIKGTPPDEAWVQTQLDLRSSKRYVVFEL